MKMLTTTNDGNWPRWVNAGATVYYMQSTFSEKDEIKAAGFSWNPEKKLWFTIDRDKASKLSDYAVDLKVREELEAIKMKRVKSLAASRAASTGMEFPHNEGMDYLPFQKAGIEYSLGRDSTLIGDEMGLGKTIQALGYINCVDNIKTVLVICPASIKANWYNEASKWLVREFNIGVGDSKTIPLPENGFNFVIINYDVIKKEKNNRKISEVEWDLVIIDEIHYIRNASTIGFISIAGGEYKDGRVYEKINTKHIIGLTGTAICNRPAELWPVISLIDPDRWNKKTFWYFHKRYCNAQSNGYGYDFKGSASEEKLEELQIKLRETILIRRLKSEVLKELPPKTRTVIELEWDESDATVKKALLNEREYLKGKDIDELEVKVELAKCFDNDDEYRIAVEKLEVERKYRFDEMASLRKQTAIAKIPYVIDFIKEQLEEVDKICVACHHHEMIEAIEKAFGENAIAIYGETPIEERQLLVDRFQTDPKIKIAILGIKAAGVGLTLTAASTMDVVELPWTPGDLSQVEDRLHRIGQNNPVTIYHLVLKDSIDVKMAKTIVEKQETVEATLNTVKQRSVVSAVATRGLTRDNIIKEAHGITDEIKEIVHKALRILADYDTDHAMVKNFAGYSKADTMIGCSLANCSTITTRQAVLGKRIIKKYKRQIPENIYEKLFPSKV